LAPQKALVLELKPTECKKDSGGGKEERIVLNSIKNFGQGKKLPSTHSSCVRRG